jgi:hypothetical protein
LNIQVLAKRMRRHRDSPGRAFCYPVITTIQHLTQWLTVNKGMFCAGCIARALDLTRGQAGRAAARLGTGTHYYLDRAPCSICGKQRKVIRAG